ncbi:MAG: FxsA family protein [Actinomycetota bacterium]
MPALLLVMLLVVPIAELYVIVQVSEQIGLPLTLLLLIGVSVLGTILLRREGMSTYFKAREVLAQGGIPSKELTDAFLILLGGALLLTPGFLTDVIGLVLIFPPTRTPLKRFFRTVVFGKLAKRYPMAAGGVYSAKVVRERRSSRESPRGRISPPERDPDDGDDSRGRA